MKKILLCAVFAVVAVSFAVRVQAKPVEYVKICSTFGSGFFYIPGTDTCTNPSNGDTRTIVGDPSQVNQELVLGWLIAHPYVERVAAEHGKGVSPQDAEAFFTRAKFTNAQGGTTPSEASIQAVQTAYALSLLTGQDSSTPETAKQATDEVLADLKAAHVEVSPRYGTFDYKWDEQTQSFTLSPRSSNWLQATQPAQPAASPSPSPSSS